MEIFLTIFLIGLFMVVFMLMLNFAGDFDVFGGDLDLDLDLDIDADLDLDLDSDIGGGDHQVGISYISPFVLSFLFMGFGAGGTFLEEAYSLEYPLLHLGALFIGLVTMVVMRKIFRRLFVDMQFNSTIRNRDFVGATGMVNLRIPEGDIGEIAVSTRLGRLKMAARAKEFIPEGTKVKVIEKVGNILLVEPVEKIKLSEKREDMTPAGERIGEPKPSDEKKEKAKEESDFTFEAYRKKEKAKKPTVIYDQRHITIQDSIISRSDFSEIGGEDEEGPSPGKLKDSIKKGLKDELYKGNN